MDFNNLINGEQTTESCRVLLEMLHLAHPFPKRGNASKIFENPRIIQQEDVEINDDQRSKKKAKTRGISIPDTKKSLVVSVAVSL